jgi:DNA polymerase-3 subunit beta
MEFVIRRSDLVRELQTVAGVVEKRATMPILANLLLEAKGSALQIGASDLEVTIRGKAPAEVLADGSVTLPAGKLHEIARSLPDADVRFKLGERDLVHIRCERTNYRISGQPRDDFPSFPEVDPSKGTAIPGGRLHEMIERVAFAITTDDPRYALQGALLVLQGDTVSLVATDTHLLAYVSRKFPGLDGPRAELRVIVPRKALAQVSKMTLDLDEDETVAVGRTDNHLFFAMREHRLTTTLLEGTFPRYENVMPASCGTIVNVPTADLLAAVKRVSLLGSDQFGRAIQLKLGTGKLELHSRTEMGEAQETLDVRFDGEEMTIGFNARYLLDFLGVVGTPEVRLEFNPRRDGEGPDVRTNPGDKPGQFRPVEDATDYRYVVMPMHL